jgi:hypothetical protein
MQLTNDYCNTAQTQKMPQAFFVSLKLPSAILSTDRQSGSQAVRQSGSQAVRQSGSQAVIIHIFK